MKKVKKYRKMLALMGATLMATQVGAYAVQVGVSPVQVGVSPAQSGVGSSHVELLFELKGLKDEVVSLEEAKNFDYLEGLTIDANFQSEFKIEHTTPTYTLPLIPEGEMQGTGSYTVRYEVSEPKIYYGIMAKKYNRKMTVTNTEANIGLTGDKIQLNDVRGLTNAEIVERYVGAIDVEDGVISDDIRLYTSDETLKEGSVLLFGVKDSDGNITGLVEEVQAAEAKIYGLENTALKQGASYNALSGVTAVDADGKNITSTIKYNLHVNTAEAGTTTATYYATTTDGEVISAGRNVVVIAKDAVEPIIFGAEDTQVVQGSEFSILKGVNAYDKDAKDITSELELDGFVDTSKLGKQTLTYTITDANGKVAVATRVVEVVQKEDVVPELKLLVDTLSPAQVNSLTKQQIIDKFARATDVQDGDLTNKITLTINTTPAQLREGSELVFEVKNSVGKTARKTIVLTRDIQVQPGFDLGPN